MNRKSIILTVFGILFFFNGAFGADKYVIDPAHTSMGFAIRHLVINKVKGDFKDYTATFNLDERDISGSSASAVIQVASIDTGVEQRDNDLRSPNFFDVKKYPTITFQSKRFEKRGEKEYVVIGTLTMHGVSKEIHMPFTIVGKVKDPWGKTRIGIESEFTLNRLDYGIGWNKKTADGGLVVGHTVDIEMNFEMIKVEN
jgi:polyisoprenoid-binding protein YceI